MRSFVPFPIFLLAIAAVAAAEPPPLVTDRPDVTESSETVGPGTVQVELGYAFTTRDLEGTEVDVSAFPATLVRVGLNDRIELRLEWGGYQSQTTETFGTQSDETGSADLSLGAKIKLREERGAAPRLAVLFDAALPTGSGPFRSERIDPRLRLAGSHTLTERLGLGYNVGYGAETVDDGTGDLDTRGLGRYSVALGAGLTERWGLFGEVFGFLPADGGPAHSFDAGATYLASKNVQLDVSGGFGLNDRAEDWFVGVGLSFRLPR